MKSHGSMSSCGSSAKPNCRQALSVDGLVGVDAPQSFLLDPTVEAFANDAAPGATAAPHCTEHTRLQSRCEITVRIGTFVDWNELARGFDFGRDQRGPPTGQQRMVHPPFRPFPIADPAPIFGLGRDLDGQAGARINPGHIVLLVGTAPHIDPVSLEADETR